MSISFDAGLGDQVRDAARKSGTGLSSWLAGAAAARLRAESLEEFLEAYGRINGLPSPASAPSGVASIQLTATGR
jgi:hypothetical protein